MSSSGTMIMKSCSTQLLLLNFSADPAGDVARRLFAEQSLDELITQSTFDTTESGDVVRNRRQPASFTWKISNKYYDCPVSFLAVDAEAAEAAEADKSLCQSHGSQEERVITIYKSEAVLVYVNGSCLTAEFAARDLPELAEDHDDAEVQLLVIENTRDLHETQQIKDRLLCWCADRGWELIDFDEDADGGGGGADGDDAQAASVVAATAQKRVLEALQTCSWSNMRLKAQHSASSARPKQRAESEVGGRGKPLESSAHAQTLESSAHAQTAAPSPLRDAARSPPPPSTAPAATNGADDGGGAEAQQATDQMTLLASALSSVSLQSSSSSTFASAMATTSAVDNGCAGFAVDNGCAGSAVDNGCAAGDDVDEFDEIFAKFAKFKDTAAKLPQSERKAYAEKVVMSFWSAIGGDEAEVEGLESDSEDVR